MFWSPIASMNCNAAGFVDADPCVVILQDGNAWTNLFGSRRRKTVHATGDVGGTENQDYQTSNEPRLHFEMALMD